MKLTQSQIKRLTHVISHSNLTDEFENETLELLHSHQGNRSACIKGFARRYKAKAIVSYFRDDNLNMFKQHSSIYSKLRIMYFHELNSQCNIHDFLFSLMSDDSLAIEWLSQYSVVFNTKLRKDRNNPKDFYCHPFHIQLAIAGEWEELAPRCEKVLEVKPPKERKYLVDHRFMLALATGNKQGMIDALDELTSPKVAKIRNKEFGLNYTEMFISTFACIFMKTAMIHGYELDFENQWIPKDWIPINPPTEVPIPEKWKFMQEYDFWEPLQTKEGADWQIEQYSPKPNARIIIEDRLYTTQ